MPRATLPEGGVACKKRWGNSLVGSDNQFLNHDPSKKYWAMPVTVEAVEAKTAGVGSWLLRTRDGHEYVD